MTSFLNIIYNLKEVQKCLKISKRFQREFLKRERKIYSTICSRKKKEK